MTGAIGIKEFWWAISNRATAATVVATDGLAGKAGFLALSATHLSARPPRIMMSVDATTSALGAIRANGVFTVNCLSKDQQSLFEVFGGKTDLKGAARFEGDHWTQSSNGAPKLSGAVAVFDCILEDEIPCGEAHIVTGLLTDFFTDLDATPYVCFRGRTYA
jgi:flavin reductase (DIM6/NTAB) family NADH-FMN oxidoreductase RutF